MDQIYRITVHGKTLESRNLRSLLARAVSEKRSMDRAFRLALPRPRMNTARNSFCGEAAVASQL